MLWGFIIIFLLNVFFHKSEVYCKSAIFFLNENGGMHDPIVTINKSVLIENKT